MTDDKTDIDHLAKLANLPVTAQEKKAYGKQLPDILKYVDQIQSLDLTTDTQTAQVTQKTNELRDDVVTPGLTQEAALSQAKETHRGYFVVPAIFDEA